MKSTYAYTCVYAVDIPVRLLWGRQQSVLDQVLTVYVPCGLRVVE